MHCILYIYKRTQVNFFSFPENVCNEQFKFAVYHILIQIIIKKCEL